MKEFNYKRAWEQYVRPECSKLTPAVVTVLEEVAKAAPSLEQEGASHHLRGEQVSALVKQMDGIPLEELARASQVVYYFGHLAPSKHDSQKDGLYWKFQILADESILGRQGGSMALDIAKREMDRKLKEFHDHKEGTDYANDELPELIQELLPELSDVAEVEGAENVNFKPHPFVIGPRHFPKDGGMFINPHQAPCAAKGCNLSYEEHTSERALFVRPKVDPRNELFKDALKKILKVLEENSIKIDGFALLKPEVEIDPEVEEFVDAHDDERKKD